MAETIADLITVLRNTAKQFNDLADEGERQCAEQSVESICAWCREHVVTMTKENQAESIASMRSHQLVCKKSPTADLLAACKRALARIESDIETPTMQVAEGNDLRAAIHKAESGT